MGRIVLAAVVVGVCAALAVSAFAQITNEACVLRCLDHGHLDQYCQRICTNGVPPAEAPTPNRTALPSNTPAAAPAPQAPAAVSNPLPAAAAPSVTPPSAQQPAASQPVPQPSVQPAPRPVENAAPPQPVAAQATPQQSVKPPTPPAPPARPVNEACVLHCLDHGHLDQYCERVCTH
jgi:hypothetical protein